MSGVKIGQKTYDMPPRLGISVANFLTVADIERSARYYEQVFGAHILSLGDGDAPWVRSARSSARYFTRRSTFRNHRPTTAMRR